MSALQVETDSQNTHMLLGALLLCVQDSVYHEETESSDAQSAPDTNLLSSGESKIYFCHFLAFFYMFSSKFDSLLILFLIFILHTKKIIKLISY